MCDFSSTATASPLLVCIQIAIWLAMVPEGTNKASSLPNKLSYAGFELLNSGLVSEDIISQRGRHISFFHAPGGKVTVSDLKSQSMAFLFTVC